MNSLPPALAQWNSYRQFILCEFAPDPKVPGKTQKFPLHPLTLQRHSAHDPSIWVSADEACFLASQQGNHIGVGFVFTADDPFFFIDVDNCKNGDTYSPIVYELMGLFPNCAVEVSHSQKGLHIFGVGRSDALRRKKDVTNTLFDLYTEKRFVALTGQIIHGCVGQEDCSPALAVLVARHLTKSAHQSALPTNWATEPCPEWRGPSDDDELLRRAMQSQSIAAAFGAKASFAQLWKCDLGALSKAYPSDSGDVFNRSLADSALAQHLAFWTGKNHERILRLMRQSGLVRAKWDREDYLVITIQNVVAISTKVLTDKTPEPQALSVATATPQQVDITGATYLNAEEQKELFKGCVYVTDLHSIMIPSGYTLRPDQFKVAFGGRTFAMELDNRHPTRNAWEAFTESRLLKAPRAHSVTFRPDLEPGLIFHHGGVALVNNYVPVQVERKTGDVTPFTNHLRKLLPDERDQKIFLSYIAAIVQHPGVKFQWCVFLQGVEGNGKTFFSHCVDRAVGERYSHWARADTISKQFNAWQLNKIFIAVEDMFVQDTHQSVWEVLKPMITGDRQDIEPKGVDSATRRVCCNYLLNGNRKNGVPMHKNGRRAAVFFTAQQEVEDLLRDGITEEYVSGLYRWAKKEGGFAIISEFLHTYPIDPAFDPSDGKPRAPETTSTAEAICESYGRIEQEILEAVAQDRPGFCGGWISSIMLDRLLEQKAGAWKPPLNQRRAILQKLGYDWHKGLTEGRAGSVVEPDNGKPKLFIKQGHIFSTLHEQASILREYTRAQNKSMLFSGAVPP